MRKYDHLINAIKREKVERIEVKSANLITNGFYIVEGQKGNQYKVEIKDNLIVSCTCPHSFYRKCICKHMIRIASITNFDIEKLL